MADATNYGPELTPDMIAAGLPPPAAPPAGLAGPSAQPAPPPVLPPPPDVQSTQQQQSPQFPAFQPQPQQGAQPPKPFGMPLLAQFLGQMFGGNSQERRGYADMGPGQPARPISRLESFEGFLGQFLNAFSQGMQASGHGPGANIRGAGAAMQAPYQTALQQYGLGQQAEQRQAEIARTQAQTEQMGRMVTLPNGMTMPLALAEKVFPAMVNAQGRVAAKEAQPQFINTSFGVYDTKAQKYVGGAGAPGGPITVTPQMAQEYGFPQQMVGKGYKASDLSSWMRGEAAMITPVKGANDSYLANKVKGTTQALGVGNPNENALAWSKFNLQKAQFERDTFGQLFGKTAEQYPSLVSLVDPDGNALGWRSPAAPTSSIKTQAQQAQDLHKLFQDVKKELAYANAQGKLGPMQGRMNELMTGKIGLDDPEFAKVRALGSLTASGMLKAHFGARGGQEMYGHFESLFNTGQMTVGDLLGALDGFDTFMNTYASRVATTKGGGGGGGGNKPPTGQVQFTPIKPS